MAKKSNGHAPIPESLQLRTLSGTYEAARAVTLLTHIETVSTFDQLAQRLRLIAKDKQQVVELYDALNRLHEHNHVLGLTTLVRPSDHPLVTRLAPKESR